MKISQSKAETLYNKQVPIQVVTSDGGQLTWQKHKDGISFDELLYIYKDCYVIEYRATGVVKQTIQGNANEN